MKQTISWLTRRPKVLLPPLLALRSLTSKTGLGVYASSDTLFRGAVFGRDSIEVAEDLLAIRPRLVRRIILTLASLQGEEFNHLNEEEPGKIIHEYRTPTVDGRQLAGVQKHIYEELSSRWGGDHEGLVYYGSVDSTPLFIRLVDRWVMKYDKTLLKQTLKLRSGNKVYLQEVVDSATDWLVNQLQSSSSGLLEYHRKNPVGIENQVWKDSREFYTHANGEPANHHKPIASIEVQGLAYDALLAAARLNAGKSELYKRTAENLRDKTIHYLWQPAKSYFALGTDYDQEGQLRIISTLTANPAALLDSGFFDDLSAEDRKKYISGIVTMITSKEFLTDGGVRSRALCHGNLIPYWDYHGTYVTWPKETHDIAKGLRRQGFVKLAKQLENRLLNLIRRSKMYLEFAYVDEWGRVMASAPSGAEHGQLTIIDSTNNPEIIQGWTVSAVIQIINTRIVDKARISAAKHHSWQTELEQKILANIPKINRLLTPGSLAARYPSYPYKVIKDKSKGSTDMPAR